MMGHAAQNVLLAAAILLTIPAESRSVVTATADHNDRDVSTTLTDSTPSTITATSLRRLRQKVVYIPDLFEITPIQDRGGMPISSSSSTSEWYDSNRGGVTHNAEQQKRLPPLFDQYRHHRPLSTIHTSAKKYNKEDLFLEMEIFARLLQDDSSMSLSMPTQPNAPTPVIIIPPTAPSPIMAPTVITTPTIPAPIFDPATPTAPTPTAPQPPVVVVPSSLPAPQSVPSVTTPSLEPIGMMSPSKTTAPSAPTVVGIPTAPVGKNKVPSSKGGGVEAPSSKEPTSKGGVEAPSSKEPTSKGGVEAPSSKGGMNAPSSKLPSSKGGVDVPPSMGEVEAPSSTGGMNAPSSKGGVEAPSSKGGMNFPSSNVPSIGGVKVPSSKGGVEAPSSKDPSSKGGVEAPTSEGPSSKGGVEAPSSKGPSSKGGVESPSSKGINEPESNGGAPSTPGPTPLLTSKGGTSTSPPFGSMNGTPTSPVAVPIAPASTPTVPTPTVFEGEGSIAPGTTETSNREAKIQSKCGVSESDRSQALLGDASTISPLSELVVDTSIASTALTWLDKEDELILCSDGSDAVDQRYVLAVLYFSMNGFDWTNCGAGSCIDGKPWLDASHECEWYGIECDTNNTVTKLTLKANNLVGVLPEELYFLTGLVGLSLDHNIYIGGEISESIGKLTKLTYVELDENFLGGPIPEALYSISTLQAIDLNGNKLMGTISESISKLPSLSVLQIEDNLFEGALPTGLASLEELLVLYVHGNNFTGTSLEHVCALMDSRRTTNPAYLQFLTADCKDSAKVECSCCDCF